MRNESIPWPSLTQSFLLINSCWTARFFKFSLFLFMSPQCHPQGSTTVFIQNTSPHNDSGHGVAASMWLCFTVDQILAGIVPSCTLVLFEAAQIKVAVAQTQTQLFSFSWLSVKTSHSTFLCCSVCVHRELSAAKCVCGCQLCSTLVQQQ